MKMTEIEDRMKGKIEDIFSRMGRLENWNATLYRTAHAQVDVNSMLFS